MTSPSLPTIIQGGMGAGVSNWRLARAVSRAGQLGVVAGTALDVILVRRLQRGDPGGHMRRALARFPFPDVARAIVERYFVRGGVAEDAAMRALPLLDADTSLEREQLIVAANFAEVHLAREGHDGAVGINYLEKIQLPTLPSLFGAMLAGVGYVLMGAGIPRSIPAVLDQLAAGEAVQLQLDVRGAEPGRKHFLQFDPRTHTGGEALALTRPRFLAIVASTTVATVMARKAAGRVDGLILEGPTAGGHNAPPRGPLTRNADGEPVFGERDLPNLAAVARLGLPFWLAGGCAGPEGLREAQRQGATGIQVGTAFAFCAESGIEPELKQRVIEGIRAGTVRVRTDAEASPTGFPFKVLELDGTLSEADVFEQRTKVCDLGYLRHAYARPDGNVGWRCPGEPERAFLSKGGEPEEITGRKCVCNGLLANIGLAQVRRDGEREAPLLTSGADTAVVVRLSLAAGGEPYSARDVLEHLLERAVAEA